MPVPFIVPAYAAVLALIYIVLAIRVSRMRQSLRITIGSGGNMRLERAIRAHANFSEYVPLALLLLFAAEMQRTSIYLIHLLCLILVIGRVIHAYGISQEDEAMGLRITGGIATFLVLVVASVVLLYDYVLFAGV